MIENIIKYQRTNKTNYKFSVLIPTWNNIEFLKLCINSILKNSHFEIQIIVIVNEDEDGTLEWLENQKEIDYVHSKNNIGICYGLNIARALVKSEYMVYVNDDMYVLPNWDLELHKEIEHIGSKSFMLSCTMIEPTDTGNSCVIVKNYGQDIQSFKEEILLNEYHDLFVNDWSGSTWPPNVVHVDMWDLVGGLSIEFTPGMYSDPDFSRKLFEAGVRLFKGKGNSLVYHFGSKSTKRIKKNNGRKTFLLKWGITSNTFTKKYLKIGKSFSGNITTPVLNKKTILINKLKRIISC
ncbi:MAG: glycosyltransferase [Bacteroidales bacterium]|jgi:glycosyltransferase involved in cell wall biosynthesis